MYYFGHCKIENVFLENALVSHKQDLCGWITMNRKALFE